jgi:hypothetical protein
MEKLYTLLLLISLSAIAPNVWAQPPDLPEGECVTPELEQCVSGPSKTLQKWSEGTEAWPDEACNPEFSFGDCDTNSCDHANAWAQSVCEANGFDVGIWTGNKQAGCGPGGPGGPVVGGTGNISMYCEGTIPCEPFVETECAPTDQTQIEVFCCKITRDPVAPIPTMSEIGLIALAASLGIAGYMAYRRRKHTA